MAATIECMWKCLFWKDTNYEFYESAEAPSLITSLKQFSPITDTTALASVVRLEAEFEVGERGKAHSIPMKSCAIIGAAAVNIRAAFLC